MGICSVKNLNEDEGMYTTGMMGREIQKRVRKRVRWKRY